MEDERMTPDIVEKLKLCIKKGFAINPVKQTMVMEDAVTEINRLRVAYKLATGRYPEPSPEPPSVSEAEVDAFLNNGTRDAVIEECATIADLAPGQDWSDETTPADMARFI